MKNTLKLVLIVIGLVFIVYGFFNLLVYQLESDDVHKQLYAMMALGVLFVVGGISMGKR